MSPPFRISVTSLSHDGRGIGFLPDGKVVFVEGALPGQTVACILAAEKKKHCEARMLEVLQEQEPFVQPLCPHLEECGGCPLQRLPYEKQLFWKEKIARDAMLRIGGFDPAKLSEIWQKPEGSPLLAVYRNKVELAFGKDRAGNFALGFRGRRSHTVISVTNCALFDRAAQAYVDICREQAIQSGYDPFINGKGYWRSFVLRKAEDSAWHGILITSRGGERQKVRKLAEKLAAAGLASVSHLERSGRDSLAKGEKLVFQIGEPQIQMCLGGRKFEIGPESFFQVNSAASELLAAKVITADTLNGPLLDVYCGAGAPGQLLSPGHEECFGIELDAEAIDYAKKNAILHDLPAWRYRAGDAGKVLSGFANSANPPKWTTALLDPPRAGMDQVALQSLVKLAPEKIIYVSCNPASLARDANFLKASYRLDSFASVDLFPHTPHLECVSSWTRT